MDKPRYNILYGMLAAGKIPESAAYWKRHTSVASTRSAASLRAILVPNYDDPRLDLYVSTVCAAVLETAFGNDISRLDPDNTYELPELPRGSMSSRPKLYELTKSPSAMRRIVRLLDEDIRDRLTVPTWLDYMAAGCLQLLREII